MSRLLRRVLHTVAALIVATGLLACEPIETGKPEHKPSHHPSVRIITGEEHPELKCKPSECLKKKHPHKKPSPKQR